MERLMELQILSAEVSSQEVHDRIYLRFLSVLPRGYESEAQALSAEPRLTMARVYHVTGVWHSGSKRAI